jgi:chromosome segregation ATPase
MKIRAHTVMLSAMAFVALALAASLNLGATPQAAQSANEPLAALLSEVHALRLAMEQTAAVAPRVQLTLARLNIQEQRATRLGTQLDEVRRQLADAARHSETKSDELADVEKRLQGASNDQERKGFESEQRALKGEQTAEAALVRDLRTRENEAAQAFSTEQARWVDLNARLDDLERLLAPVR